MEKNLNFQKEQITNYIKTRVLPILQPLQLDILKRRPENVLQYAESWLRQYQQCEDVMLIESDDEQLDEIYQQKLKNRRRRNKGRQGVSGQVYSSLKSSTIQLYTQDKCQELKIKIMIKLRNCILFRNLSQKSIENVITCMRMVRSRKGDVIIKEGTIGDQLFLVDHGTFKCEIQGQNKIQKIYESGEVFGQLSLLYNTPRASTITAIDNGVLYSLDRTSFNQILRNSILNRTKICEQILNKSQIFSTMNQQQKNKLCESLKQTSLEPGRYIIKEGQLGDRFFIVLQGNLVAQKIMDDGELKSVYYYKKGDYFGEIALIRNLPRQASIKALTSSKLAYIERSSFKRLLGSLQQLLKRNQERYKKIKRQVKNKI